MAKKGTAKADDINTDGDTANNNRVSMQLRSPQDWAALLDRQRVAHYRVLQVTIKIRDRIFGGRPVSLNAANAMLKARGLQEFIEVVADIPCPERREAAADKIATSEGLCAFDRRPGKPGLWLPTNNIKAGFKENWSVTGRANSVRGSRKATAEGVFIFCANAHTVPSIERDWILLGPDDPPPLIHEGVTHTTGPMGPLSSIKRNEYLEQPTIVFDMYIANAKAVSEKFFDEDIADVLVHYADHGLGASRSQGYGKFDVIKMEQIDPS